MTQAFNRRDFIKAAGAASLVGAGALGGCATIGGQAKPKVIVVGGGWGGATAAKYLAMWGEGSVDVTLIEPRDSFISCPISNLVLAGAKSINEITVPYSGLDKYGIRRVKSEVTAFDPSAKTVTLADGSKLPYDRLVLSPGIDFMYETIPGLATGEAKSRVLHAWKPGPETLALRRQLEAMPDGGVYAIHIPKAPYRCPPGPYERSCMVARYFQQQKPKSKVVILDANEDVQSKKGLFMRAWNEKYKGLVEYRNNQDLQDVDARTNTVRFTFGGEFKADVLNVLPPMRAGNIATMNGLNNANKRWCLVDFLTYESTAVPGVHVLGDAIQIAPGMPKSGHMANQHGKICAAAILALLSGKPVNPMPVFSNTCYSFIDEKSAVHVASVHRYNAEQKTMSPVAAAGGVTPTTWTELEGAYAMGWAQNIWNDMLA